MKLKRKNKIQTGVTPKRHTHLEDRIFASVLAKYQKRKPKDRNKILGKVLNTKEE